MMNTTRLKGGSLSSTTIYHNRIPFVRKEVATYKNREYGYIRWYSQLRKMQRFERQFPGMVPKIFNIGANSTSAFYDMQYMDGYKDMKTLLSEPWIVDYTVEAMNTSLWRYFDTIHAETPLGLTGNGSLYFHEEVEQKLFDAKINIDFAQFTQYSAFKYNDQDVPGIFTHMHELQDYFSNLYIYSESYTHGNPTLENMMYSVKDNEIVFIDLYDETSMESKYLDYAQVLQCSRSHYGYINDRRVQVDANWVSHDNVAPYGIKLFNELFEKEINNRCLDKKLIDVLEATQFIRMLPFKIRAGEIDKAKFFFVHACKLLDEVFG